MPDKPYRHENPGEIGMGSEVGKIHQQRTGKFPVKASPTISVRNGVYKNRLDYFKERSKLK